MATMASLHGTSPYACGSVPLERSLAYCFAVSVAFVASLYVLVPLRVRGLNRDDSRQIQWRTFATAAVCGAMLAAYPVFVCKDDRERAEPTGTVEATALVLGQAMALFLGPMVQQWYFVMEMQKRRFQKGFWNLLGIYYGYYIEPRWYALFTSARWIVLRYLVIAPIVEEIAFRGCIVSALHAAGMSETRNILLAPLFFGTAHVHHAVLLLRQGHRLGPVIVRTLFQFAYTSLFGSYATFAYLKTQSIVAVAVCHAFCNAQGLPDLSFLRSSSPLYKRRTILLLAHVAGIALFIWTLPKLAAHMDFRR